MGLNKFSEQPLTEQQEVLLMSFVEGQTGMLDSIRARILLSCSSAAKIYAQELKQQNLQVRSLVVDSYASSTSKVDLWARVSQRIEAEQRAEVFLGKRRTEQNGFQFSISKILATPWFIKGSGATVLASAIFGLIVFKSAGSNEQQLVRVEAPVGNQINSVKYGVPRILEDRVPNTVEVDWMRSDGRVHILPEPSQRSAIIWVRKRQPGLMAKSQRAPQLALADQVTPVGSPSFTND